MKKVSDRGIKFIEAREGVKLKAYHDQIGKLTIGVGHLVLPRDHYTIDSTITLAQASALLENDLRTAESAVTDSIKVALNQNQFDALVSLTFNIGDHAERHSSLVTAINQGATSTTIKEKFLAWEYAGGKALPELEKRRMLEYNLYIS